MRQCTLNSTRLVTTEGPQAIVASPGVRNMYGCLPCYRCGSGYRAPFKRNGRFVIECDECGHVQKAVMGAGYV